MLKEHQLTPLFQKFITSTKTGRRLKNNGTRIKPQSIKNYESCLKLLNAFAIESKHPLLVYEVKGNNKREHHMLKKHWDNFYKQFTNYLYNHKNCYDNYTGNNIKIIRTFFKWLNDSNGIATGPYFKNFYVAKEEVDIITLTIEQLQFLAFNKAFEATLSKPLKCSKDVFVIGCMVGLRFSDLCKVKLQNIMERDGVVYLKVKSQKTATDTLVKLPAHAMEIVQKYRSNKGNLLPTVSLARFNKNIKKLGELAGWVQRISTTRNKRGVFKEKKLPDKAYWRFCDAICSHTMRRTCITTMLTSGMPEFIVRKISGHTSDSKAFFRYVNLAQSLMDKEIEKMHVHFDQPTQQKMLSDL